jgi:hypothetical protein
VEATSVLKKGSIQNRSACDIFERSAIIADAEKCSALEADRRALAYAGFASFAEFARQEEARIRDLLDRLPGPTTYLGMRLRDCSLLFLQSRQFEGALQAGWTIDELFALGSPTEEGSMGPIAAWALIHWPATLASITPSEVCLRKPSGRRIHIQRFRGELEHPGAWWEADEIILWH